MHLKTIIKRISPLHHFPKKILVLIILVIIGGIWLIFSQNSSKIQPEYTSVKKGDIKQTVTSSGTLVGKNTTNLKFPQGGKLTTLDVTVNQSVEKGAFIASLDTQALNITLQKAENDLRNAESTLAKVYDEVKDSDKDETFEEREKRTKAETAKDSAFDSVKAAKRAYQDAVLFAPVSGLITAVYPVEGQFISASDIITTIIDQSQIYFEAEVDESDINKINLNQAAEISLNSYSDQKFAGFVEEIYPQTKTTTSGATVILVRINLRNPNLHFIANSSGQADIVVQEVKNTLVIPLDAIIEDNFVYIQKGNSFEKVKIETGLSSDTEIEIKMGVSEGQNVLINPSEATKK